MKVQVSTTIASPPSEVAAFTSDARNEAQWHTDVHEISITSARRRSLSQHSQNTFSASCIVVSRSVV
jgi:hypothetical protein